MRKLVPVVLGLMLSLSGAAAAQVPDWVAQVLKAAQLPVTAAEARTEGVPDSTVRTVLEAMKTANVPASEAKDMLDTARAVNREHGPVDNFGAFVQAKLAAGLRGRDLAAAIRAEHAARGKGKAKSVEMRGGSDKAKGSGKARGDEKRRPDDKTMTDDKAARAGKEARDEALERAKGKAPTTKGRRPDRPNR